MKNLKIFADPIEQPALQLIDAIASHPHFNGLSIRIMPDVHAGRGIVVGFTCPVGQQLNPEHIGADIGCGIDLAMFSQVLAPDHYPIFEQRVRNSVAMGMNLQPKRLFDVKDFAKFVRKELNRAVQSSRGMVNELPFSSERDIAAWCRTVQIDEGTFYKSIGTLGGGNHFMELDYDPDRHLMAFTVHTGSRNLGQKVSARWTRAAQRSGGYLEGESMAGYLTDMVVCQAYAKFNRQVITQQVELIYRKLAKGSVTGTITSVHNYLDFSDMMIRKGAIRSYRGEPMVIPFNMRDGIAIAEGKSNADWNCSAPHGAGRIMSRNQAKSSLTVDDFAAAMQGIYSTSVGESTLDEAPMAYKDPQQILRLIEPTCTVTHFMRPVVNIKDTGAKRR